MIISLGAMCLLLLLHLDIWQVIFSVLHILMRGNIAICVAEDYTCMMLLFQYPIIQIGVSIPQTSKLFCLTYSLIVN